MDQESAILIPKIEPQNNSAAVEAEKVDLPQKPKFRIRRKTAIILTSLLVLLLLFTIPLTIFSLKAKQVYSNLLPIVASANEMSGDIEKLKNDFNTVRDEVSGLRSTYSLIGWMKYVPFAGGYVADLGHGLDASVKVFEAGETAFVTLDPLLKELGYKEGGETAEKSAQERIDFVVNSIPQIIPKADEISGLINEAEMELSKIDPNRYPEEINGVLVRDRIRSVLDMFKSLSEYVFESKPLLESMPYLLGVESDRNYLVLFQNDKELRPTGGFLTAYSVMKVSSAKFEPVSSDDIYNLDAKYKPAYPAPQAIVDLIKGPYILSKNVRLRDMNYNPDFKESMDFFTEEAAKVGMKDIDGIIAVDTQLLVNLLQVLGDIGVSGFGNYSAKNDPRCNCPQVVYELESFADIEGPIIWDPVTGKIILRPPNSDNRKKIIGPLMNSILANAMAQPKEKLPDLISAIFTSVVEKHVLLYMFDEKAQAAAEGFNIAGRIVDYQGDYLHVNDSNLGGRKSNLYVRHEVEQDIEINKDGLIEKTVTLTYKNPEKHDGWLNSVLFNWVRLYVPKGSKLISVEGLQKEYETAEELGKTVFSGYFSLRPEGVSKVIFKYTLPFKVVDDEFKLLIQKQAGTDAPLYIIRSGKFEEEFLLRTDKEIKIKL